MYATFMGGADPATVVLNGSNKTREELAKAVELGVTVNIDAEEEIDALDALAHAAEHIANVNLRLKVVAPEFAAAGSDYFGLATGLDEYLRREKWGFSQKRLLGWSTGSRVVLICGRADLVCTSVVCRHCRKCTAFGRAKPRASWLMSRWQPALSRRSSTLGVAGRASAIRIAVARLKSPHH